MAGEVLGFRKKDAKKDNWNYLKKDKKLGEVGCLGTEYGYKVPKSKLVPVVELRALGRFCKKNELRIERQELEGNEYPIVFESRRLAMLGDGDFVINKKTLLSWARGQAGKVKE